MSKIDQDKLGELLSAYLDHELDANERRVVDSILREDASARRLLSELRETSQSISSLPRHAAPVSIVADIQSRLERTALLGESKRVQSRPTSRSAWRWIRPLSMAAVVALTALGYYWFSGPSASNQRNELAASKERAVLNIKRELATGETVASVAKSNEKNKTIALQPPLDVKLAEGASPASIENHTFESEPVVLQVAAATDKARVAVANTLAESLRSQGIADFRSEEMKSKQVRVKSDSAFFVNGKAGVNFESSNEQQILVHAPRSQVDAMLASLSKSEKDAAAVELHAGAISARGVEASQQLLQITPTMSPQNSPSSRVAMNGAKRDSAVTALPHAVAMDAAAAAPSGGKPSPESKSTGLAAREGKDSGKGYFGGMLKLFGLDPNLLALPEKHASAEKAESKENGRLVRVEKPGEPPSLVSQGIDRMKKESAAAKDSREAEATSRRSNGPLHDEDSADRNVGSPPSGGAERGTLKAVVHDEKSDPTITMVVQIVPLPADQAPSAGAKALAPTVPANKPTNRTKSN